MIREKVAGMRKTGQTAPSVRTAGAGRRKPIPKQTGAGNGASGGIQAGTDAKPGKTGIIAYGLIHPEPASAYTPGRKPAAAVEKAAVAEDRIGAADAALPEGAGRAGNEAIRTHSAFGGDPRRALVASTARIPSAHRPSARAKDRASAAAPHKDDPFITALLKDETYAASSSKEETFAAASRTDEAFLSDSAKEETFTAVTSEDAAFAAVAMKDGKSARLLMKDGIGTAEASDDSEASKEHDRCIVCGAADREGIRILARLICESCEREIVKTDVGDARYPYFIHQLRSLWHGETGV